MKARLLLAASILTIVCNISAKVDYRVIPLPQSINIPSKAGVFAFVNGATVTFPANNFQMQRNAELLCEYLHNDADINLTSYAEVKKGASITLSLGLQGSNPDAYKITVDKRGVKIEGTSESGVFHGIQTLRKAIGVEGGDTILLPYVSINDYPRFSYRGVHLDCARHYFDLATIKTYIDLMALHGCNNLHWHITDDQGWRFEMKSMPELAREGSIRKTTVIGHNLNIYDGQPHGGYYTQDECREIVRYAAERYINVIPEVDLPGHMVAALHVHPELGCTGGPYEVLPYWGVADDVLCAGNPKTLEFLKKVMDELTEVFPSPLIHIGGDESPRVRWQQCNKCQAMMKKLGLTHEAELQTYINKELEAYLARKGRTIIGWDETLEGGLSDNAIVMSWRGYDGGIAAARQHHHVIMTPTQNCYIDYYQLRDRNAQPLGIGGYLPLSKVYSMEPVPEQLSEEEKQYIMGPQANLWTEYVQYPEHLFYMLLPRLDAISEVQWTTAEQKNFADFEQRLPRMLRLYDKIGCKYCPSHE